MLKIKDKNGKLIGTLEDSGTEPEMKCKVCEGTGWDFKDTKPPFKKCNNCKCDKKEEEV